MHWRQGRRIPSQVRDVRDAPLSSKATVASNSGFASIEKEKYFHAEILHASIKLIPQGNFLPKAPASEATAKD
jgi:hypothetical protein